jgi:endonuclease YncB( thermonuclease family)
MRLPLLRVVVCLATSITTAFFASSVYARSAQVLTGKVVGVSDGDTLTLLDERNQQHKIRLAGIDAPESGQAFGQNSKRALSDCAFGQRATITVSDRDRYDRSVGKVIVGGVDCNLLQIKKGMAWHFKKYEKSQPHADRNQYAQAEDVARAQRAGLWSDARAIAPWDWRSEQRSAGARSTSGNGSNPSAGAVNACPCGESAMCTGPKGGRYCTLENGKRRYSKT